jgi:hypothetical protein
LDLTSSLNIDDGLGVSQDLGSEASVAQLGQDGREVGALENLDKVSSDTLC